MFADVPSTAVQEKRINFLRSLAKVMTQIQSLSFDSIGMPILSEDSLSISSIGPVCHWNYANAANIHERTKIDDPQALESSHLFMNLTVRKKYKFDPGYDEDDLGYKKEGRRTILKSVCGKPPFERSDGEVPESFTIHHNDLDLQNILVDEDGNVTGIIDWDHTFAGPRCVGPAAVPKFLQHDWFPRYVNNLFQAPHMAWNTHYYREIYAAALVEAGNPDAKFTTNSAMYQAAVSAVTCDGWGCPDDFVSRLLRSIPQCRVDLHDFYKGMGLGWRAAEEWFDGELEKMFAPEMPRSDILNEVDFKCWWGAYDDLLDFYEYELYQGDGDDEDTEDSSCDSDED